MAMREFLVSLHMNKILVPGGCGYIGAHTIADLIENGFEVISADNNSRSNENILEAVEKITGKSVKNYKVDLCIYDDTVAIFQENPDITGIIHFAAYKSVGESVKNPLLYFENNLNSLINILKCADEFGIPNFVFSSSCTVYGNPDIIPVTEESPMKAAESAYGATKQMGEQIVRETVNSSQNPAHKAPAVVKNIQAILLRYCNPVGAHPSALMGELPLGKPENLVPFLNFPVAHTLAKIGPHRAPVAEDADRVAIAVRANPGTRPLPRVTGREIRRKAADFEAAVLLHASAMPSVGSATSKSAQRRWPPGFAQISWRVALAGRRAASGKIVT